MDNRQKRITGRAPSTYTWEERGNTRRPVHRAQPQAAHAKASRKKKNPVMAAVLPWVTLVVVVMMISMIIGKCSAIASGLKLENNLAKEKNDLVIRIENIRSEYDLEIRADIIKQKARAQLGMIEPAIDDVILLKNVKTDTPTLTLAAGGSNIGR